MLQFGNGESWGGGGAKFDMNVKAKLSLVFGSSIHFNTILLTRQKRILPKSNLITLIAIHIKSRHIVGQNLVDTAFTA